MQLMCFVHKHHKLHRLDLRHWLHHDSGLKRSDMLSPRAHLLMPLFLALPSVLDMLLALASWEAVNGGFHSTKVLRPCGEPSSDTTFTSWTPAYLTDPGSSSLPQTMHYCNFRVQETTVLLG